MYSPTGFIVWLFAGVFHDYINLLFYTFLAFLFRSVQGYRYDERHTYTQKKKIEESSNENDGSFLFVLPKTFVFGSFNSNTDGQ